MSGVWHASELTPAEVDICMSVLDVSVLMREDAIAHLALALLCGTVERAGVSQREFLLEGWRVLVRCPHG